MTTNFIQPQNEDDSTIDQLLFDSYPAEDPVMVEIPERPKGVVDLPNGPAGLPLIPLISNRRSVWGRFMESHTQPRTENRIERVPPSELRWVYRLGRTPEESVLILDLDYPSLPGNWEAPISWDITDPEILAILRIVRAVGVLGVKPVKSISAQEHALLPHLTTVVMPPNVGLERALKAVEQRWPELFELPTHDA